MSSDIAAAPLRKRRVGIFGGTFNPVHNGHLRAAGLFCRRLKLDLLYVVPNFSPPHKQEEHGATPAQRLEMARLAFADFDCAVNVSDIEIRRGGRSFTRDTLDEVWATEPDLGELFFLVGTDMFLTLDKWRDPDYLFNKCTFVLLPRGKGDLERPEVIRKQQEYRQKYSAETVFIPEDAMELSSTEIRRTLAGGGDVSGLLPERVLQYIETFLLYK